MSEIFFIQKVKKSIQKYPIWILFGHFSKLFEKKNFGHKSIDEIFNNIKSNKRILLFIIENEMLVIDKTITSIITKCEYTDNFDQN